MSVVNESLIKSVSQESSPTSVDRSLPDVHLHAYEPHEITTRHNTHTHTHIVKRVWALQVKSKKQSVKCSLKIYGFTYEMACKVLLVIACNWTCNIQPSIMSLDLLNMLSLQKNSPEAASTHWKTNWQMYCDLHAFVCSDSDLTNSYLLTLINSFQDEAQQKQIILS